MGKVLDFRRETGSPTNIERTGERDMAYSIWHRPLPGLSFVDIDAVEMCKKCQQPLALIEHAIDTGQPISEKKAYVTVNIARRLDVPAYVVLYSLDNAGEITGFRVQERYPEIGLGVELGCDVWAGFLRMLHLKHEAKQHGLKLAA